MYNWKFPGARRSDRNTSRSASGENFGPRSEWGPKLTMRRSPLCNSTMQMRVLGKPSSFSSIVPAKATRSPSGETITSTALVGRPLPGLST